jgi:deoxyribose-phosphate aldolase
MAADLLKHTPVRVCSVAGFPHGASTTDAKAREAVEACRSGAAEVDMVLAVFAIKDGNAGYAERDIRAVVDAVAGRTVKVILETGLLSNEEKILACRLAVAAGAHFVKTSTGMGAGGATADDIRLMRQTVGPKVGVKASGGIRTLTDAESMVRAGATRIGTSAGVAIVTSE